MKQKKHSAKDIILGRVEYRPLWALHVSNIFRAVHQVGGAVFLTSCLFHDTFMMPLIFLLISSISGVLLLFFEAMRHRQIWRELTGVVTFGKLILLGLAYHGIWHEDFLCLVAFLIASLASHAPKTIRHRLLF